MMDQFFNNEMVSLLAVLVSLLATLVLFLTGRRALIDSRESRLSALDEMIADRRSKLGDKGELEAKVETLSKKRDELQSLTLALQNDLNPLKAKHTDAVLNYEKEKEKLRTLREECSQMQDKVELFEMRIKQLSELEGQVKELTALKEKLQAQIDAFPKINEELEKAHGDLIKAQESLQSIEGELAKAEIKKIELEGQLVEVERQLSDKTETLAELDKQIQERKEEVKKREQILHDVNVNIDARIDKLKTIGQIPEDAFRSLRTPWLDEPKPSVDRANEMVALEKLNSLVVDSGFKLSKRLQYAFHTSLKTSDISCLTVMAGVSGTGKSAFPKLYSQAMGIHFLPLAVEPRWDSPQDLFGFLNYMENRYEATTLGRALVQFNNAPLADHHATLNNQVLMVLLDEMNLARIEYYFSEFLSKLEMRRTADLQKEEDYKNVSLEIFAGYPADPEKNLEGCPAIRLFAGRNILFVGTMNEDESTQSLSDKVIDRANVLHFGKPDKLSNIKQNVSIQSAPPLSIGAWSDWICDVTVTSIPELHNVEKQLNDINTVLADLGRPFGWRTFKAISAYIANYPDKTNLKLAVADQVVMRVMPKLRGVDVSEHSEVFNRLETQVNQLEDIALQRAFKDARESNLGFFNWRGINWDL
jgi:predicted  nucleic acid-binding Zn-ribbon protein